MNTRPDRLDEAIDHVAKRLMTHVTDDDALATRILASLPDRSPWHLHAWIPRLAITAMLAAAISFVVLRTFDDGSTGVLRSASAGGPFVEFRAVIERTPVEPELIARRTTVERLSNIRRTAEDFERSLDAIAVPAALSLKAVTASELPGQGSLFVEPLTIADLPLTAETISPR